VTLTNLFQIDGKSLYAPDCDIEPSYSDLDSSDSGRDEAGYMHREVVREKVSTWPIAYSCLTDDEYKYTISVHPSQSRLFHRDRNHHLLLQQIRHRLAQCQDETVEEP
jgi:hypothetical protein